MPNISLPHHTTSEIKDWYNYFFSLQQYVRGDFELRLGGILDNSIEKVGNANTTATDLVNYVFEKNQLKNNGDVLAFSFKGTYATNGNNKQLIITFGSQTIFDTTALAINGGAWIFDVEVIRTSTSTQDIFVKAFYNDLSKTVYLAGTQSDNITIKLTATGVATNDIELKSYIFNFNPID
jgi:hypothetical protein